MSRPIQPICKDERGVLRFEANAVVNYLLDNGGIDMNQLAMQDFSQEDQEQFAQLIGYSLSGFGELSYVSDETYEIAEKMTEGLPEMEVRNYVLSAKLKAIKAGMRDSIALLFGVHPDDFDS